MQYVIAVLFGAVVFFGTTVTGWPQVREELVSQTLYVDNQAPHASDSNPGTQALPLNTISAAAEKAIYNQWDNIGTKVLIAAGIYREHIDLSDYGPVDKDVPVVFEAQTPGNVIVSGSDIWTDWQQQDGSPIYDHTWPYAWGRAPIPPGWPAMEDIVRRQEMLFVNGSALTQVLSQDDLTAGTFYVSEGNARVSVWPPTGIDMTQARVEVASRPYLFEAHGKKNVVLRGIIFQHANTPVSFSAVRFADSSYIVIEDCEMLWNNWGGFEALASHNVTVRRTVANYNGGIGMNGWRLKEVWFEQTEASYNNWRGVAGDFTDWASAGLKHLHVHGGVYRQHRSVGNQTHAMWFDTDNTNIQVEEAFLCNNLSLGLYLEANQGPIAIKDSIVCNNTASGILSSNSRNVAIEESIVYGNDGAQIEVNGLFDSSRPITNWETGEKLRVKSENWTLLDNAIAATNSQQFLVGTTVNAFYWTAFQDSLTAKRNVWHSIGEDEPFQIVNGELLNFADWQTHTSQDYSSDFTAPLFTDPANGDFTPLPASPFAQDSLLGQSNDCTSSGQCGVGEGDCDNDDQCQSGLSCVQNVGSRYDWPAGVDVCEVPRVWDWDYCSRSSPCGAGEGDCDKNRHCQSGLMCVHNVAANYGGPASGDVCEPIPLGHSDYCTGANRCGTGEGDCDINNHCQPGLVCVHDVGANYGWDATVDVCEPVRLGHSDYCLDTNRCGAGEGDCDGDNHCQPGLTCVHDVGANYGWAATVDVCE